MITTEAVIGTTALGDWLPLLFMLSLVNSDVPWSLVALVAICRAAYKEPVEGLVSLVGLAVLESVSELYEERPVGVGVFCAFSRKEEGVQQQVLRKDLM